MVKKSNNILYDNQSCENSLNKVRKVLKVGRPFYISKGFIYKRTQDRNVELNIKLFNPFFGSTLLPFSLYNSNYSKKTIITLEPPPKKTVYETLEEIINRSFIKKEGPLSVVDPYDQWIEISNDTSFKRYV